MALRNHRKPSDDRSTPAETLAIVSPTATAVVGSLLTMSPVPVLTAITALGLMLAWNWDTFRARSWWSAFRAQFQDEDEARAGLRDRVKDRSSRRVVMETIRRMMEALDDEAVKCLASLAVSYEPEEKGDAFFRGMARMLQDITAEEIGDLRTIAGFLADLEPTGTAFWVAVEGHPHDRGEVALASRLRIRGIAGVLDEEAVGDIPRDAELVSGLQEAFAPFPPPPSTIRVFQLLKGNMLATDPATTVLGPGNGPNGMMIEHTTCRRILAVVGRTKPVDSAGTGAKP